MLQTQEFIQQWYKDKPQDDYILLWTIDHAGKKQSYWYQDCNQIANAVSLMTTRNVYVGMGTSAKDYGEKLRAKESQIIGIPGLWCDIDYGNEGHTKTNNPPSLDDARSLLSDMPLAPTIVVSSGHGLHAYWQFDAWYPIALDADRVKAKALETRCLALLSERAKARGWQVDSVQDLPRVLRIPGSINNKTSDPLPCDLITLSPDNRYSIATIEGYLPASEAKPIRSTISNKIAPDSHITIPTGIIKLDHERMERLLDDKKFTRSLERKRTDLKDTSDSAYEMSLVNFALMDGWSDQETVNLCIYWRKKHGLAIDKHPVEYYSRTLQNVHNDILAKNANETADFKSELGNSQRFINQYGDKVRYVYTTKKWMYYDGTRWLFDATGQVRRWAKACVISLLSDAANCETDNERKAMVKHAMTSQSHKAISGMLALAESERPLQPDELDTNHWLLNLKNGTFNLETNTLQPHNRLDYISRIANVTYDPQAAAPPWDNFVHWAMCKDNDLKGYLQRAIGYGATGVIREHAMFIAYGTGANGKSTFFSTIQGILGDYAQGVQSESIMIQKATGGANNDIASLRGSRFVVTNEGEDGSRLAESLIKKLTGDDLVRARFLYGELFEFKATHKLFFTTNHKPIIKGTDNGIWRRMKMIPFANTLKLQEQDTHLPDKLAKESAGILNWIIAGCTQWRLNGLGTCETVDDATKGYRNEMDIIAGFIDDCCITTRRDAQVKSSEIYTAYVAWCEANGERATSQKKFGMSLIERGFTQNRTMGTRLWDGIGLLETLESMTHMTRLDHFPETSLMKEDLEKVYGNTPKRVIRVIDDKDTPLTVDETAAVSSVHNESPNTPCLHCGKTLGYHWNNEGRKTAKEEKGVWACNVCYALL